jgi:hypothetical protein
LGTYRREVRWARRCGPAAYREWGDFSVWISFFDELAEARGFRVLGTAENMSHPAILKSDLKNNPYVIFRG